MLKSEYTLKVMFSIIFVFYILFQGSLSLQKINDKLLSASLDKINLKKGKISFDYAVVGGSNALLGISSQQITEKTSLNTYNFAISAAEGAGVLNYQEWLKKTHSTAKKIIYSSMNAWYLGKNAPFEMLPGREPNQFDKHPLIATPLIRTIAQIFKKKSLYVNEYGDLTMISCDTEIPFFEPAFADINNIDQERVAKFIQTIELSRKSLDADDILIRIPPVYVASEHLGLFQNYLIHINDILKKNGLTVLGLDQAITTDPTKMCFGPNHPTSSAREAYTDALIHEITSYKQLVLQ
ncbi:MAG TPA: hypothetical protein VIZ65_17475 [Cellvibrionaceae bacterium]